MKNLPILAGVAIAVLAVGSGPQSRALADNVLEACSKELTTHCANVVPGNGHLYACLYANEEKMSEECDAATADVLNQMDLFFEVIRYTKQACLIDIEKHCSGVEIGGGRVLSCLKSNKGGLSDACGEVVRSLTLPES